MTPWLNDPDVRLYHGDALEVLRQMPSASVHMCATSPPFYGLRDYGSEGQIGLEETPDRWVERLVHVFREVRRVLRDDGTLWVEIGDSYVSGQGGRQSAVGELPPTSRFKDPIPQPRPQLPNPPSGWAERDATRNTYLGRDQGVKPKDLLGQPWLLAKALRDPYYTGRIKNENDRVWLAAIIDGEGSIGIHKRPAGQSAYSTFEKADGTTSEYVRKQDSFQPKLEITNTNLALMERVVAIAGGNCDTKQEAGTHGRKQTIYRWTVTADKCRDLIAEVYPHLVAKQHEARLAHGCPSSGEKATAAHEALKLLHGGSTTGIDFPAPGSMWEAGWYLRSEIIWAREPHPNPMPESVTDRPTKSHSTVFLLSKGPRYFFDQDAIREPYKYDGRKVLEINGTSDAAHENYANREGKTRWPGGVDGGANARSVWTVPTEPTPFAHFATWPQALVRRMILAGTSERGCCPECGAPWVRETSDSHDAEGRTTKGQKSRTDERRGFDVRMVKSTSTVGWSPSCAHDTQPVPCTVLDPFAGSGTTLLVARQHGRHSIGIELNADYCRLVAERTQQQSLLADGVA